MKTDPFSDAWQFLLGDSPDQVALGEWRWPLTALFLALLALGALCAFACWRRDPHQRTAGHFTVWALRTLMGCMWFQGALWKLPLPVAPGLRYWTEQMAGNAAYPWFADLVRTLILPNMTVFDPLVLAAELGMATSLILGILVRPVAFLGIPYVLALWIGLYRHPGEWPWEYIFIAIAHALFVVSNAGRILGLDRLLYGRGRG